MAPMQQRKNYALLSSTHRTRSLVAMTIYWKERRRPGAGAVHRVSTANHAVHARNMQSFRPVGKSARCRYRKERSSALRLKDKLLLYNE